MKNILLRLLVLSGLIITGSALAQPNYQRIEMEIEVAKPAAEVWAKVGDYCDISEWLGLDCEIASGDGGIGTVRVLRGGSITEILVAQTELSYGYTQPVREGTFYNLYHGFMEARPAGPNITQLRYTLVLDVSNLADQAAIDAALEGRRTRFTEALQKMKEIAETD